MPTNRCLQDLDHSALRALRALELRDLNLVDTSWSAFNYYIYYMYIYVGRYIYIIREAMVVVLHLNLYGKYRQSIAGETFI